MIKRSVDQLNLIQEDEYCSASSATPAFNLIHLATGEHVGWMYLWNTGSFSPMWKTSGIPIENCEAVPISPAVENVL